MNQWTVSHFMTTIPPLIGGSKLLKINFMVCIIVANHTLMNMSVCYWLPVAVLVLFSIQNVCRACDYLHLMMMTLLSTSQLHVCTLGCVKYPCSRSQAWIRFGWSMAVFYHSDEHSTATFKQEKGAHVERKLQSPLSWMMHLVYDPTRLSPLWSVEGWSVSDRDVSQLG